MKQTIVDNVLHSSAVRGGHWMMCFKFTIFHVPGKNLPLVDALLMKTYFCSKNCSICEHCSPEPASYWKVTGVNIGNIRRKRNESCRLLSIWMAFQTISGRSDETLPHWDLGPRRMVDERQQSCDSFGTLRLEMLNRIHSRHQGISRCHKQPKQSFWSWGLTWQLEKCSMPKPEEGTLHLHSSTRTPLAASRYWFVWIPRTFNLLDVDYYPRFIEIAWHNTRRGHTNETFARYGVSEVIVSDNESQYSSEAYAAFARQFQFGQMTSKPCCPQKKEPALGEVVKLHNKTYGKDHSFKSRDW